MDEIQKPKAKLALVSIILSALSLLLVLLGLFLALGLSAWLNNWSYIILGVLLIGYSMPVLGILSLVFAAQSLFKHENKKLRIIAMSLAAPLAIIGTIVLILGVIG